jgi:glucoamylase
MHRAQRAAVALIIAATTVTTGSVAAGAASTAPGSPGEQVAYLPSDKAGFGTSSTRASHVWYTLQPQGGTGEIYFPSLATPAARRLDFAVVDPSGHAVRVEQVGTHRTVLADPRSLTYRHVDTGPGKAWQLQTTYVTDPARSALRIAIHFESRTAEAYRLFALYEPTLANTPSDDSGRTHGATLVASDKHAASALLSTPAFTATSNGYRGASDGWTDLSDNGRMDWHYTSAPNGNIVQTGQTALTGRSGHRDAVLTIGFGHKVNTALATAQHAAGQSFEHASARYEAGWHQYLNGLGRPPASLTSATEFNEYFVSEMVLAASEDKLHPGAYVASPTMPWAWGAQNPTGPYHLVWSRDLYEIATALIADGDRAGANRALTFLFTRQQKADGSFPQNSTVAGKPFWGGLQLDEVADPIVLSYQLHRVGKAAWSHVKAAADFLLGFHSTDGYDAPYTPQDRWENQSGYSPATISSEIAGLVCAAAIARHNGANAAAHTYLTTADSWRAHVKGWTATDNGPYAPKPYFLRLTKDGKPNVGTTYSIGDSGPSNADQRSVVDPSFLELVRLGVLPANDKTVRNSIKVVDAELGYRTARGMFWHRASFDGYGEQKDGGPWILGSAPDSRVTLGRGWPLLSGERGEYYLAAGNPKLAADQLTTMSKATNPGGLLPEQVWDNRPPNRTPGTPTLSATPLAWTHAQFIRLAQDLAAGRVVEQPAAVRNRYH